MNALTLGLEVGGPVGRTTATVDEEGAAASVLVKATGASEVVISTDELDEVSSGEKTPEALVKAAGESEVVINTNEIGEDASDGT